MGTPDFSVPILEALALAGHDIVAVYCQPPRAAGRGQNVCRSPVNLLAEQRGYDLRTPISFKDVTVQKSFRDLNLDVAVVAAYGLILPKPILEGPNLGCLNVHASLLPRWRGAAPIQRAILAGDEKTGVTIMKMDEELDTGPLLMKESVNITDEVTGQSLHDHLSELGARLIVEALSSIGTGTIKVVPQSRQGVTYASKLQGEERRIDWRMTSIGIHRQVRAFAVRPGAWFKYGKDRIKVLKSKPINGSGTPGIVLEGMSVACGEGVLQMETVQPSGKNPMDAADFLNGYDLPPGTLLT